MNQVYQAVVYFKCYYYYQFLTHSATYAKSLKNKKILEPASKKNTILDVAEHSIMVLIENASKITRLKIVKSLINTRSVYMQYVTNQISSLNIGTYYINHNLGTFS